MEFLPARLPSAHPVSKSPSTLCWIPASSWPLTLARLWRPDSTGTAGIRSKVTPLHDDGQLAGRPQTCGRPQNARDCSHLSRRRGSRRTAACCKERRTWSYPRLQPQDVRRCAPNWPCVVSTTFAITVAKVFAMKSVTSAADEQSSGSIRT